MESRLQQIAPSPCSNLSSNFPLYRPRLEPLIASVPERIPIHIPIRVPKIVSRSETAGQPAALSSQKVIAMPDLTSQIGILYRVIGQSQPALGSGPRRNPRLLARDASMALDSPVSRRIGANIPGRWICAFYCLWFSLPLSIWLSSGWIGLLLYWQALAGTACLLEKLTAKRKLAFALADSSSGDAS